MAMEGHFQSHKDGAPLILFGLPDQARRQGQLRRRNSEAGIAGSQAFAGCAACGPRHRAARKLAAGADHVLVVPDHGRNGISDAGARPVQPVDALARRALRAAGCCICSRWRWDRPASSPCLPAGSPPRSGASRSRSTACCGRLNPLRRWPRPRSAHRCIAFVIVYFIVYAAGLTYLYPALDGTAAASGEQGPGHDAPARAAGITPAAGAVATEGSVR